MLPELQIHSPAWNLHWPLLALSARVHHLSSWTAKHTWVLPLQSHCLFSQSSVGTWVLLQTRQHIPELQEPFLTHLDPHNPYSTGLYEVLQWTLKILFQIKKILSVYKLSPLLQDFQLEDTLFSLPATLNFHFFPLITVTNNGMESPFKLVIMPKSLWISRGVHAHPWGCVYTVSRDSYNYNILL